MFLDVCPMLDELRRFLDQELERAPGACRHARGQVPIVSGDA